MAKIQNAYVPCREVLLDRLREAAPARIQLLTGPRQVGKPRCFWKSQRSLAIKLYT
ncbi:MAG: hypothetical protein ABSC88_14150 [Terracidiphilus sp.]|jgi:predicted AAA+ superfamily ATPase